MLSHYTVTVFFLSHEIRVQAILKSSKSSPSVSWKPPLRPVNSNSDKRYFHSNFKNIEKSLKGFTHFIFCSGSSYRLHFQFIKHLPFEEQHMLILTYSINTKTNTKNKTKIQNLYMFVQIVPYLIHNKSIPPLEIARKNILSGNTVCRYASEH